MDEQTQVKKFVQQAQKREILADTQIKINRIDDKIRQLAALTYEVEA